MNSWACYNERLFLIRKRIFRGAWIGAYRGDIFQSMKRKLMACITSLSFFLIYCFDGSFHRDGEVRCSFCKIFEWLNQLIHGSAWSDIEIVMKSSDQRFGCAPRKGHILNRIFVLWGALSFRSVCEGSFLNNVSMFRFLDLSGERSRKGYLPPNPIEKSPYREKQGLQSTCCLGMLSGIWENCARLLALFVFSGL